MGILYYLAREDDRTLFKLGKWTEVSDLFLGLGPDPDRGWVPRSVPPEADFAVLIRRAIEPCRVSVDEDAYARELARRVSAFCGDQPVLVLNDASSDQTLHDRYEDGDDRLRVVDSVYPAEWEGWGAGEASSSAGR